MRGILISTAACLVASCRPAPKDQPGNARLQQVFFQEEPARFESFHCEMDRVSGGYTVYAKAVLPADSITTITNRCVVGTAEIRDHRGTAETYLVAPGGETRLFPLPAWAAIQDAAWWDLEDLSSVRIFLEKGRNDFTHAFWHWWLVPEGETRTVYLFGRGI